MSYFNNKVNFTVNFTLYTYIYVYIWNIYENAKPFIQVKISSRLQSTLKFREHEKLHSCSETLRNVFSISTCSSHPHQKLIGNKLKQRSSCVHSNFAWQEWMGLLILSPQHWGLVFCLEDGFSFHKLTKHLPEHQTGGFVFVPFVFLLKMVFCWNCEAKNSIRSPKNRAEVTEETMFAITAALKACTYQTLSDNRPK